MKKLVDKNKTIKHLINGKTKIESTADLEKLEKEAELEKSIININNEIFSWKHIEKRREAYKKIYKRFKGELKNTDFRKTIKNNVEIHFTQLCEFLSSKEESPQEILNIIQDILNLPISQIQPQKEPDEVDEVKELKEEEENGEKENIPLGVEDQEEKIIIERSTAQEQGGKSQKQKKIKINESK